MSGADMTPAITQWTELTDEDRQRAFESLPDMLDGFLKTWGWLHFAKAIEAQCRAKNEVHTVEALALPVYEQDTLPRREKAA